MSVVSGADEKYHYEPRRGQLIGVPLLAFVDGGIYINASHGGRQMVLGDTSRLYSLLGLGRNEEKFSAAEIDPERGCDRHHPRQKPYISPWADRDDTWTTHMSLRDWDGHESMTGTRIWILPGVVGLNGSRNTQTREDAVIKVCPANAGPTDEGEWSTVEHRTLLGAVKPGDPFRKLGVRANMQGDGRKQLDHVRKRVDPGIACMTTRWETKFSDVLLVSNIAVLKQAGYGIQFTTISKAGIINLMGKTRKVALRAARVPLAGPCDFTEVSRDLHGLGLINCHTANTANKIAILHQMLNGPDADLVNMPYTEMWVVSQQTGALGSTEESPCCPTTTDWWGRTAVPRSLALQTWIEMAKYDVDTNTMLENSTQAKGPRQARPRLLPR